MIIQEAGKAKGLKITSVWDLDKITPMFRVPSGVLFAEQKENKRNILQPEELKE